VRRDASRTEMGGVKGLLTILERWVRREAMA
jgi:hypothetical protein